jgi:hypothetical protein
MPWWFVKPEWFDKQAYRHEYAMQNREIEYQRGMNPSKRKKYHDQLKKKKKDLEKELEKQRQKEYKMIQAELKKDLKNTGILEHKPIIQNEINENAQKRKAEIAELAAEKLAEKLAEKKRREEGEKAEKERRRGMTEAQIQDEERRIRASDETREARELEENRRQVLEEQRQAELQRERERTHRINADTANAEIIAQRERERAEWQRYFDRESRERHRTARDARLGIIRYPPPPTIPPTYNDVMTNPSVLPPGYIEIQPTPSPTYSSPVQGYIAPQPGELPPDFFPPPPFNRSDYEISVGGKRGRRKTRRFNKNRGRDLTLRKRKVIKTTKRRR